MAESSVVLNPGSGGSSVRVETVTTTSGSVVQQVISHADGNTGNLQAVNSGGEAAIANPELLAEMRMIRVGLQMLLSQFMGELPDLEGAIN